MDILTGFENYVKRYFPPALKAILNYQLEAGVGLEFEVPNYGRFELLDYSKVIPVIVPSASQAVDRDANPYYLMKDIESYLRDFYPVVQFADILPFARNTWGDQTLSLFVESNQDNMILVDLDSHKKPFVFNAAVESLIDIRQLSDTDGLLYGDTREKFEAILQEGEFVYSLPDWINSMDDCRELISSCLLLAGPDNVSHFEPLESVDNTVHRFRISAVTIVAEYTLSVGEGMINRDELIEILNDFLGKTALAPDRRFYQISQEYYHFGIACTDQHKAARLSRNGYLHSAETGTEYSPEEKELIRNASDLFSEIENVQFCLKVMHQKLSPEYSGQTVSIFYETGFIFDSAGLALVKKMTGIEDLEKEANGYNLIYTVG